MNCKNKTSKLKTILIVLLLCLFCNIKSWASETPGGPYPATEEDKLQFILSQLKKADAKLTSFVADFKETRIFLYSPEPEVAEGKIYFKKPQQVRWDYHPPGEKHIVLTPTKAWLYLPEIKQVQLINLKGEKKLSSLPIGLSGPSPDFEKNYQIRLIEEEGETIENKRYILELTPVSDSEVAAAYTRILLTLSEGKWLPADRIELLELTGDKTIIELSEISLNTKISSKLFKFDVPKDVEIIDHTEKQPPSETQPT